MDKIETFLNYMIRFNNFCMFLISGGVTIIGIMTFNKYNIGTIEFLFCIMVTLMAYHYVIIYGQKIIN